MVAPIPPLQRKEPYSHTNLEHRPCSPNHSGTVRYQVGRPFQRGVPHGSPSARGPCRHARRGAGGRSKVAVIVRSCSSSNNLFGRSHCWLASDTDLWLAVDDPVPLGYIHAICTWLRQSRSLAASRRNPNGWSCIKAVWIGLPSRKRSRPTLCRLKALATQTSVVQET